MFYYKNNNFVLTRKIVSFSFYPDYEETKLFSPQVALVVQDLTKEYIGNAVVQRVNFNVNKF